MSNVDLLKSLGLTEKQIQEKVVSQIADQMLYGKIGDLDYEDVEYGGSTEFRKAVDARITKRIDEAVGAIAEKHTLPNITEYLEGLCLQKTNDWGEKKGESLTFVEYLGQRADAYLREAVDHNGKPRGDSYGSFSQKGTRAQYLIDKHLDHHVSTAMKSALQNATTSISESLNEACRIAISNLQVQVKTDVKTK